MKLLLLLLLVYVVYAGFMQIEYAVIIAVIMYIFKSSKEGMSYGTDKLAWFEPEGYSMHNSLVNPEIVPRMYKYGFDAPNLESE
jgi:hypothetical protein